MNKNNGFYWPMQIDDRSSQTFEPQEPRGEWGGGATETYSFVYSSATGIVREPLIKHLSCLMSPSISAHLRVGTTKDPPLCSHFDSTLSK